MTLRKRQPGDPLRVPAKAYNAFVDAAEAYKAAKHSQVKPLVFRHVPQSCIVRVKNSSGADVGRFGVLGIGGPLFDPATAEDAFKNEVIFDGATPYAGTSTFVICLRPITDGSIGQAVIVGVTVVTLTIDTEEAEDYEWADANGSTETLSAAETGPAMVLFKVAAGESPSYPREALGIVLLNGPSVGMEDGADDGEMWVWKYDPTAEPPVAEWIRLAPPAVYSVLVFDPAGDPGARVQWVAPAECTGA